LLTGVTAAVGSIAALTSAGNTQLGMLANVQQGLRGTQASYEAMGQTVVDVAKKVSQTSGLGLTEALEVAKTLANNRYFAGTATDLERLARLANDLGTQMGGTAADGAKLLGEAMRDPTKFAQEQAANFNQLSDTLRQEISLAQKGADANGAFVKVVSALEAATGGAARNGLSPIARAWQDLGNAFTGGTSGWKPFMDWLANDAAATIRNFTDLIRGLGDTWRALRSGLSQEQGIISMPGVPGGGSGQTAVAQTPTATAQEVGQQIATILRDEFHASEGAIAGVIGNAMRESGLNPASSTIDSNGLRSSGLFQWNGPRNDAFAAAMGVRPEEATVRQQVMFAMKEVMADPSLRQMWAGMQGATPGAAAGMFTAQFERPRDVSGASAISAANANQFAGVTAPTPAMVDSAKALNDELAKQAENTRNIVNAGLDKQIAATDAAMKQEAATVGTDSDRYRSLSQILDEQKAKRFANVDASVAAQRQAESGLRATQGLTAADQALSAAMEARRQVSLQSRGEDLSAADAAQTRTNVLAAQTQEYDRLTHKLTEQTANQAGMAAAYKQGNQAVVEATAMQQAYTAAVELFGQNIPAGKFQELVDFYKKLAENTAIAQTAQQNLAANDNLSFIQAQTATLGLNEDARNRLLAVMKAEQEMHRRFGDILPQEAKDYIALAASTVDATAAFTLQQNSLKELTGFFDNAFNTISSAITQAFATGNLAALKFKDIAKSGRERCHQLNLRSWQF
jgi:hypothetical protein